MDEFLNGNVNEDGTSWIGLLGVKGESEAIIYSLENDLPAKIEARFNNYAWMEDEYADLLDSLDMVYDDHYEVAVTNPDPLGDDSEIIPTMWETMGPPDAEDTELNAIK